MKDSLIDLCMTCTRLGEWWSLSLLTFSSWLVGASHEKSESQTSRFINLETLLRQSIATSGFHCLQFFACIHCFHFQPQYLLLCLQLLFVSHRLTVWLVHCLLGLCCNGTQNFVFSFRLKLPWVFLWHCCTLCQIMFHNQHSSVYDQSVGWTILFSISGRWKRFFSSPKYSHLSWGPPSLLSMCPSLSFFAGVRELWHGMTGDCWLASSAEFRNA